MTALDSIFGTAPHVSWSQECARAVVVLAYGLLIVRLAGRRVFGRWSALDIVVAVVAGSNLSRVLTGNAPLGGTLAATTLLMFLHWVLAQLAARFPRLSWVLEGGAVPLAEDGRKDPAAMARHSVSDADLDEALRQSGVLQIENTRRVVLEPSGKISVLRR